ncbi:MAG: hypothetical protein HOE90_04030 [Bacteriovoracaceae bacterium]|jgi:hypothetical protein|nr:hypothetical protein [Bacteriovoracaceae bacterium]
MGKVKFFALMTLCLFLSNCEFNDPPPDASVMEANIDGAITCEVDSEKLANFMEEDLQADLLCISNQLKTYAQVDQRKYAGFIQVDELIQFLLTFMNGNDKVVQGIKTLFEVNYYIFNDKRGMIAIDRLDPLFDLLIIINREVRDIASAFELIEVEGKIDEVTFYDNRDKLEKSITELIQQIKLVYLKYDQGRPSYPIEEILNVFLNDYSEDLIEDIKQMLFIKPMLVGGKENILTYDEFLMLFDNSVTGIMLAYDLVIGSKANFSNKEQYLQFLKRATGDVREFLFHKDGKNEKYFSIQDLIYVSKHFEKYLFDLTPFEDSLYEAKESSIIGGDEYFSYDNIDKILNYAEDIFSMLEYFNRMWFLNETYLLSRDKIDSSKLVDATVVNSSDNQYNIDFKRILDKYRFMKGDSSLVYIGREYERSLTGIAEIGIYEYLLKIAIKAYGAEEDSLTEDELLDIVIKYDEVFIELGTWRNPITLFTETQSMMINFFRTISNGNKKFEVPELVSWINMQLSGLDAALEYWDDFYKSCKDDKECFVDEEKERFSTKYFYENFFNYYKGLDKYLPKFSSFVNNLNEEDSFDFTRALSRFGRQCPYDYNDKNEVLISQRDVGLLTGAMMSIEETFLRFDTNQDGDLEFSELEVAIEHFKPVIVERGGLTPATSFLARTVFYYILIKGKVPKTTKDIIDLVVFHGTFNLFYKKSKVHCNRFNLVTILEKFVEYPEEPNPDCYLNKPVPR